MKLTPLRYLLLVDAVLLFVLGAALILVPRRIEAAFGFRDLPDGVNYMVGLWGCVFVTMAIGYFAAARDPLRNVVWVQVGIARGAIEFVLGVIYVMRGMVSWQQAAFGVIAAAVITLAYIVLYPRQYARPAS
ncbi:MAG TPA: hypothetical protein VK850_04915 [Candidatus Binatia bacterium]|nr:hypothetical protein [Candidatus Binatia bacterium]